MEKVEKKSFWSRLLGRGTKPTEGKTLYSNTKQTSTKIKLALLELLNDKELSQINITNLVKVAGIYRATFYLHYKSLNDVILDIEKDVYECYNTLKEQMQEIDLYNNMSMLIEKIGEYINIDKKYLQVIINTNCFNRITLKLKELLYECVVNSFVKFGHMSDDSEFLLNISMFTGGLVFAYRDWINCLDMKFDVLQNYIKKVASQLFEKIDK
ncbi:MAG: TetR/AcrR family transcriptional regulator [Clostridia bacterium]|nr:TetR/AcrR family transcriptional regulator [Clostridia bacterium]